VGEGGGSGANGGAQERPGGDRQAVTLDLSYRFQISWVYSFVSTLWSPLK